MPETKEFDFELSGEGLAILTPLSAKGKTWAEENINAEDYQRLFEEGIIMENNYCQDIIVAVINQGMTVHRGGKEVYIGDDGDFYLRV